jgi:hypothetical protein
VAEPLWLAPGSLGVFSHEATAIPAAKTAVLTNSLFLIKCSSGSRLPPTASASRENMRSAGELQHDLNCGFADYTARLRLRCRVWQKETYYTLNYTPLKSESADKWQRFGSAKQALLPACGPPAKASSAFSRAWKRIALTCHSAAIGMPSMA